jgi:ribosome recycling factor
MKDHALKDALFKAEKEIQNIYTKSHDSLELAVKAKEKEIMSS